MDNSICREAVLSNEYYDFIVDSKNLRTKEERMGEPACIIPYSYVYRAIYYERNQVRGSLVDEFVYITMPKCFALMDVDNFEAERVYMGNNSEVLGLNGEGVIIGFIDTGIRYESNYFRNPDGTTRIIGIWDQTIQSGTPPEGFVYGSQYTQEDINLALRSMNPLEIVPSTDDNGHGTYMASVSTAGNISAGGFSGCAPRADIAVVKLKEAKQYLKEFYLIEPNALAYQENDIMFAMEYLNMLADKLNKPLVICLGIGSNMGEHAGQSAISQYINLFSLGRRAIVIGTGDEANQQHHFSSVSNKNTDYVDVDVQVSGNHLGFWMELWGEAPDIFTISVMSPSGEMLPRVPYRINQNQEYTFLFEGTVVTIHYVTYGLVVGNPAIIIRMIGPTDGIWKFRIFATEVVYGNFHMWLPVSEFIQGQTYFLKSDPNVTLVEPSAALLSICTSAYNTKNNSIFIDSGRGFTSNNLIKPDLAAPGVGVAGVGDNDQIIYKSGTSSSAAITAAATAMMFEWGIVRGNYPDMGILELKSELIRGAERNPNREYPNQEWGFGTLDLYHTFENFRLL